MSDFVLRQAPVHPTADKIVIQRLEPIKRVGKIYLADSAQEKPNYGIVLAVGDKTSAALRPRTIVLFGKYAGIEVEAGNDKFLIMREEEVAGTVIKGEFADNLLKELFG